jgi:hypothetical protein
VDQKAFNIILHVYSHYEWLDVVEITFLRYNPQRPQQFFDKGCVGAVRSSSSGCLPPGCPGAPCLSTVRLRLRGVLSNSIIIVAVIRALPC